MIRVCMKAWKMLKASQNALVSIISIFSLWWCHFNNFFLLYSLPPSFILLSSFLPCRFVFVFPHDFPYYLSIIPMQHRQKRLFNRRCLCGIPRRARDFLMILVEKLTRMLKALSHKIFKELVDWIAMLWCDHRVRKSIEKTSHTNMSGKSREKKKIGGKTMGKILFKS